MLVDDYTPTKRLGIEEMEGLQATFEHRMDNRALGMNDDTPEQYRDEGAWLAVHLLLTGRFKTQQDFIAVFDNMCGEVFGEEV